MTVAAPPTIPKLLESLTASLISAETSLPEASSIVPPKDGISLLDIKNDLFLSYLQHLVFLILLKLRKERSCGGIGNRKDASKDSDEAVDREDSQRDKEQDSVEQEEIVKQLVRCRVYLERGVRPLEGRLKYQLDKVLRAADDAARNDIVKTNGIEGSSPQPKNRRSRHDEDRDDDSGEQSEDDASDNEIEDEENAKGQDATTINELSYRPNPAAFLRPSRTKASNQGRAATTKPKSQTGAYRPPRITPVAPPTDMPSSGGKRERRTGKSAVLDEYIATELSAAPLAEPSIGSTVVAGGRRNKTAKERQLETERREYEEANFVRLPKESRKERAAAARRNEGGAGAAARGGYGGEEWRGLGEGLDRIERLTSGKRKSSGQALLDRSRKRERELDREGGGTGDKFRPGERFEKRRKTLDRKRNRSKADYI